MAQPITAAQWLSKWGTNLNGAVNNGFVKQGVMAVTQAPGVAAAAAADRMASGVAQAVSSGKWQRAVSGVSLTDWQNAMINKGAPRIAAGVTQAQQTKTQTITALLSAVSASQASIASLPKGGLQQGIARATAFMTAMSQNAPSKQGSR